MDFVVLGCLFKSFPSGVKVKSSIHFHNNIASFNQYENSHSHSVAIKHNNTYSKFSYSLWIKIRIHSSYKNERDFSQIISQMRLHNFIFFNNQATLPLWGNFASEELSAVSRSQESGWQRKIERDTRGGVTRKKQMNVGRLT